MGYNSNFTLKVEEKPLPPRATPEEAIAHLIENCEYADRCLQHDGSSYEEGTWYDAEKDLKEVSKQFPHLVFKLHCLGEDGEQSMIYAQDGKTEVVEASVAFPEPDWVKSE